MHVVLQDSFGTISLKHLSGSVIFWFVIVIFLYLVQFYVQMPEGTLDSSWCWALGYTAANNFKCGTEINFTYGPLGYLNASYLYENYSIFIQSVIFIIAAKLVLLYSLSLLILTDRWTFKVADFLTVLLVASIGSQDPLYSRDLILTYSSLALLAFSWREKSRPGTLVFAGFLLAFNALIKGTGLVGAIAIIFGNCIARYVLKQGRT